MALLPYTYGQGIAQAYNNRTSKTLAIADTMRIDTVAISNYSIEGIDSGTYRIDPIQARLYWLHKPAQDSIRIQYRRLAIDFNMRYRHKDRGIVDSMYMFSSAAYYENQKRSDHFVDYKQLELNGSYGRSISLGNNQDVVSNSNFNLQVNGYLLDSIKVEAALTDNTVPFQPEGNTQNLQEFDQISIRLSKGKRNLQLGDYNLNKPDAYFLNYSKRVQGIFFQTEDRLGKHISNKAGFSASMAKGEFARNIFMGGEGNQGPYRLVGNNGEQLFVVLAATEKVYVDNILLERGENADYIINYNTNEVRFMPRSPINQFSRIQVEFEYRTNNYLNSLLYGYNELSIGNKWRIKMNAYSNQDAKNQPYLQNLSADQKRLLASLGDSVQFALSPNIALDTLSPSKVLYRIKDTIISSTKIDSIYAYSTNEQDVLYNVSFSYVGSYKGDYKVSGNTANGRVYEWVGTRLGDYSAVSLLIAPKMHQVLTLATEYQIDSFKQLSLELAGSNKDPNSFSAIDNASHQGIASKLSYQEQRFWGNRDSFNKHDWTLKNSLQYEYVQDKFRAIAPYRSVEFGRDWNVPLSGSSPTENWSGISSQLSHRRLGSVDYALSHYTRGSSYQGLKNAVGYTLRNSRVHTGFNLSLMNAQDSLVATKFFKPLAFAEYSFARQQSQTIGAKYYAEHNDARLRRSDSLQASAFYFDISSLYWRSNPTATKRYSYSATYFQRRDFLPVATSFLPQSHSHNYALQAGIGDGTLHKLSITGSYRQLLIDNSTITSLKPENTLLGRIQYDGSLLRQALSFATLYEIGTGQEQKRSFTYLQVPAGQDMYNWIDYNSDGVQQLNEFVLALYPDQKLYIRIFTPTDDYIKVNNTSLNQTIGFEPANFFRKPPRGLLAQLAHKASNQLALQVANKISNSQGLQSFNPLQLAFADTAILLTNLGLNNTFYLNRSSAAWGIDYNYLAARSQQLLSYGLNTANSQQQQAKLRLALSKSLNTHLGGRWGQRSNLSGTTDGNSYNQRFWATEPSLIWMRQSALRITSTLRYELRNNAPEYGGQEANIQSVMIDGRYSQSSAGIVQLRFTLSRIAYSGLATEPIAYAMLDGLRQGNNLLWYLNWQRRLGKGIELLLEYEGRKAGSDPIVNTGRMSLRAIL